MELCRCEKDKVEAMALSRSDIGEWVPVDVTCVPAGSALGRRGHRTSDLMVVVMGLNADMVSLEYANAAVR